VPEIRRVDPIEVFFDLVFVFAVTQVGDLFIFYSNFKGALTSLLLLAVLWWLWGAYAWLTNAVVNHDLISRSIILTATAGLLVAGIAVPHAFGASALEFVVCYIVVRALHVLLYVRANKGVNRDAILRLVPGGVTAALLLLAAIFVPFPLRVALWAVAVAVDYGTPLVTGVGGFSVAPGHFVERHSLVVLIALGESITAIGLGADRIRLTAGFFAAFLAAFAAIAALWWIYFYQEVRPIETAMSRAHGPALAHLARDTFSYLHFLLFAGIIFISVTIVAVIEHPGAPIHGVDQISLGGGGALPLLAFAGMRRRCGGPIRAGFLLGAAGAAGLGLLVAVVPRLAVLGALALILLAVAFTGQPDLPVSSDRTRKLHISAIHYSLTRES
jgi:low temperature requirement protein LtrA